MHTIFGFISFVLIVIGLLWFQYFVHCTLNRICVRHAKKFCRRKGLAVQRMRWQIEFSVRPDGRKGGKTQNTLVQLDCFDAKKQRRLVLLSVWVFGVRKLVGDDIYPESYDSQWPQKCA